MTREGSPPARRAQLSRRALVALAVCAGTSWSGLAGADASAKTLKAEALPPANATLHVTPGALGTSWTFELTNTDTTPLRVVTDGRLLSLEVTPPEESQPDAKTKKLRKRTTVRCALPADVRPSTDAEDVTVLEPDATYVEEFDPRLYCFDARDAEALVPGARVIAHLGWPVPRAHGTSPPFIADESNSGDERAGVKEVVADEVVTPDPLPEDWLEAPTAPSSRGVAVTTPSRLDTDLARDLSVTVTVENTSSRTERMILKPKAFAFDIESTKGSFHCGYHGYAATPIAEVFTTLRPHGKASTTMLLQTFCPEGALRAAGLYTVRARLDTRQESGVPIGIDSFDGVVEASAPMLVRVRHTTTTPESVSRLAGAGGATSAGAHGAAPVMPPVRPPRRPTGRR